MNGGVGDQEVGKDFQCKEEEGDIARLEGGRVPRWVWVCEDCHKTVVVGPGMGYGGGIIPH